MNEPFSQLPRVASVGLTAPPWFGYGPPEAPETQWVHAGGGAKRRLPERGRPRSPVSNPALARRRSRGYSRPRLGRSTSKQRDACRDQPDRQRDHRQEDDAEQQGDAADKAEVCQPAWQDARAYGHDRGRFDQRERPEHPTEED